MRISDWSSDVCSSDLFGLAAALGVIIDDMRNHWCVIARDDILHQPALHDDGDLRHVIDSGRRRRGGDRDTGERRGPCVEHCLIVRSEEHTSELQSLMRISYAVFCLKKKKNYKS